MGSDWRWALPTDAELSKMALADERAKMVSEYENTSVAQDPTDEQLEAQSPTAATWGNEDFHTDDPHD